MEVKGILEFDRANYLVEVVSCRVGDALTVRRIRQERIGHMKRQKFLATALLLCLGVLFTSTQKLHAQSAQGMQRFEQLSKDLNLTPQQKTQLVPILEAEAPKVKMIKSA